MVSESVPETLNEAPIIVKTEEIAAENRSVEDSGSEKKDFPEKLEKEETDNRTADETERNNVSIL